MNKQHQIQNLKLQIEKRLFKIDASRLRAKYANTVPKAITVSLEVVRWSMEVRMLYAQIMAVQAVPTYPKGGIAICGSERKKIILRR